MSHLILSSASKTSQVLRTGAASKFQRSCFGVKVGDIVPVNYLKVNLRDDLLTKRITLLDGKDPVILEDSGYPDYVHTLTEPLPTKNQLMKMIHEAGGLKGDMLVLGIRNIKRAKRLMGLELVRENNLIASTSK